MTYRGYLLAARNHLRTLLGLDANSVEVMFDGLPKPTAGELFIALHFGSWSGAGSQDGDLTEEVGFAVTPTMRLGYQPMDRWGPDVWMKATTGLDVICRKIIVGTANATQGLHMNETVRVAANAIINTSATYEGFETPVRFQNASPPQFREASWFNGGMAAEDTDTRCGISQTLTFGGATRVQGYWPLDMS